MIQSSSTTAVLLFTRSAGEEAAHKQFLSDGRRAENATVAAQLIAQATRVAREAGVDFICFESTAQTGHSFGQRLTDAFRHGFAQGYDQLIVIGNDCPQLSTALVRQAADALATSAAGAVLGPARDGGVYLIGVKRAFFAAQAWECLPWQTARLGVALADQVRQAGASLLLLPTLADVDSPQDLARLVPQLPAGALRTWLRRLLTAGRAAKRLPQPICRPKACAAPLPQRGPPAA